MSRRAPAGHSPGSGPTLSSSAFRAGPPAMATTAKLLSLFVRTLAKPIANQLKHQAKEHETFRRLCVNLAQSKHRAEMKLRTNLLGEQKPNIRPLSEARAIDSGSNAIAEGFLFSVAAGLILGESYRSSRNTAKRREAVDEKIDELSDRMSEMREKMERLERRFEEEWVGERERNDELTRVLNRIIDVGLRGGWTQLEDTPLRVVKVNKEHLSTSSKLSQTEPIQSQTPLHSPSSSTPQLTSSEGTRRNDDSESPERLV